MGKLTLRSITKSLGRYFAILLIVALGVGFFCGLRLTKTAMLRTLDSYAAKLRFFDLHLVSTIGLSEEDAAAAEALPGVGAAEGSKAGDVLIDTEKEADLVWHYLSVPSRLNLLNLRAGRLPERPDECVADAWNLTAEDLGKQIQVSEKNDSDTLNHFVQKEFTIVGLVHTPLYLNYERGGSTIGSGTVTAFFFVLPEALDQDYDTDLYLSLVGADEPVYSEQYDAAVDAAVPGLEAFLDERIALRRTSLRQSAEAELADKRRELEDGRQELNKAKEKLADGNEALRSAWGELNDGAYELGSQREAALEELDAAEKKLTDGRAELDAQRSALSRARAELAAAEQELQKNGAALESARSKLEVAEAELNAKDAGAQAEYQAAKKAYADAAAALEVAAANLASLRLQIPPDTAAIEAAREELARRQAAYDAAANALWELVGRQALEAAGQSAARSVLKQNQEKLREQEAAFREASGLLAQNRAALDDAEAQLWNAEKELAAGASEYQEKRAEAEQALNEAQRELDCAEAELQQKRKILCSRCRDYHFAVRDLEDGEAKILDAEQTLDELDQAKGYVLTRDANVGYVCFESDSNIVNGVSHVFPLFFFLVAALVCISSMTRLVEEQRTQIGVLKALGYGKGRIFSQYLIYTGSASVLGCAFGSLVGSYLLPKMIWQAYNIMYGFSDILWAFDWKLVLVSSLAFIVCALAATWYACNSVLSRPAAELLRVKAPKAGRRVFLERIPFIWKRLPFLHKVSVRNVLRDRRRMGMVILGIGGCTALLLTGYGIRDSITGVLDYQFEEITKYDMTVSFHRDMDEEDQADFLNEHAGAIGACLFLRQASLDATANDVTKTLNVISAVGDSTVGFDDLHDTNGPLPYPTEGSCLINDGLADRMSLSVGDSITLRPTGREEVTLRVSGIYRNYIYNLIYLSKADYALVFGNTDVCLAQICAPHGADQHAISAELSADERVSNVSVNLDLRARFLKMLDGMNYIVLVVLICAGALAFIVLYNLTNISIIERQREIATVKVLGFYKREAERYVFRENIMLTVLGLIVGYPMGYLLHAYVMEQIRIDMITFDTRIAPITLLYAAGLTMLFSVIVNLSMRPRIRSIHMAEALKSGE